MMAWNGDYYAMGDGPDCEGSREYSAGPIYYEYSPSYKYQFKNEEDLITSDIFQKCLGQALAHKDKTIYELRQELLDNVDNERQRCIDLLNSIEKRPPWPGAWGGGDTFESGVITCINKLGGKR